MKSGITDLCQVEVFAIIKHTLESPDVGQPSPVDIIMTSGDACPTDRGAFALPSKKRRLGGVSRGSICLVSYKAVAVGWVEWNETQRNIYMRDIGDVGFRFGETQPT